MIVNGNEDDYKLLVEKFAEGRKICNCQKAYGDCQYGCSYQMARTRDEIATRVVELLKIERPRPYAVRRHDPTAH